MMEIEADILGLVEVESRPVLAKFNTEIIAPLGGKSFAHVMVIDGNDDRGIDVGIMSKPGFPIRFMRSHVDDLLPDGEFVFSRDCAEYFMATVTDKRLVVLVNHFKSKGFGSKAQSDAKRKAQAEAVRDIYKGLVADGEEMVAVMGDLNDTPDSDPLQPLLKGTDLKDVFKHAKFDDGGFPGTYDLCNAGNKIDYILLSPKLFQRVEKGGVFRKGMWPGSRPKRWDTFPELTRPQEAGSDHAAVWVDVDL
jgi:endonuclease/exonuclease/phosphatase family metal-dependent hydrolase